MDSLRSSFGPAHKEKLNKDLLRKYAALSLALGMTRSTLHGLLHSEANSDEIKKVLELTATSEVASKLGLDEGAMALNWNDYLTDEESARIKGF